jgi:peptidoglycan hydrolase-like protein with peptidoglycan-binding domain
MPGSVSGIGAALPASTGETSSSAATTSAGTPAHAGAKLASPLLAGNADLAAVAAGTKTLAIGARGAAVTALQKGLAAAGLLSGAADGIFGHGTESALATLQRGAGLAPSGSLDAKTLLALDAKLAPAAPVTGGGPAAPAVKLASPRFANDPDFAKIAAGKTTLASGAKGPDVVKLQTSLAGVGFAPGGFDGSFGPGTAAALSRFQAAQGLAATGKLDAATLGKLDAASAASVAKLAAAEPTPQQRAAEYHVVADLKACRAYVLENGSDKPVASYLISPGSSAFPTEGTQFTIQSTTVMGSWTPPASAWAGALKPQPPGLDNPMGICKLSFGAYSEYFHGIPKEEEAALGTAASHGCCRMSGANILDFHEKYAGAGTQVTLVRDPAQSDALAAKFNAAGIAPAPTTAGQEYTAAYLYGEMGRNETLKGTQVVVGGTGGSSTGGV